MRKVFKFYLLDRGRLKVTSSSLCVVNKSKTANFTNDRKKP